MRVLVTGATGVVGRRLCAALVARGDQVLAHTRRPRRAEPGIFWLEGDAADSGTFLHAMGTADAVVNLAGATVATRWTPRARAAIAHSRVATTRALVGAMQAARARPRAFVSISAVGYYGAAPRNQCDESTPLGEGFLAGVCQAWEAAAEGAEPLGVRLVRLRLGVVLAAAGGMLPTLLRPVRAFVGGPVGSGQQWLSWIHIDDVVGMILWALGNDALQGPINAVAPNPTRQQALLDRLGQLTGRPIWLRAPSWALRLALGEMADEVVLASQEVVPKQALARGYSYRYPHLDAALRDLLGRS